MEVAESCCNSMRVDDTCCIFGSIISDYCPTLNAPVAFTLTSDLRPLKKQCDRLFPEPVTLLLIFP